MTLESAMRALRRSVLVAVLAFLAPNLPISLSARAAEAGDEATAGDARSGNTIESAALAIKDMDLPRLKAVVAENRGVVRHVVGEKELTLLHLAVERVWLDGVKFLLAEGAEVDAVAPEHGGTPLHVAVSKYDEEIAKALLAAGANVNAKAKEDVTPLHLAAAANDLALTELLLMRGADAGIKSQDGKKPIDLARAGKKEESLFLLQQHERLGAKRFTAARELLQAASDGDVAAIDRIAAADPKLLSETISLGWTPLHIAVREGQVEAARALVRLGADVNAKSLTGKAPEDMAAGATAMLAALKRPGSYSEQDALEFTSAAYNGKIDVMTKYLDQAPTIVDWLDDMKASALHYAAQQGHVEAVKFLLARGANPKVKDKFGKTPKDRAKAEKQDAVVKLLP